MEDLITGAIRSNVYNIQDKTVTNKIDAFCDNASARNERVNVQELGLFIHEYLSVGDVSRFDKICPRSPFGLPVIAVASCGNAGTGKSYTSTEMMMSNGKYSAAASTNAAKDSLNAEMNVKCPQGSVFPARTMFERNSIKFSDENVQALLKDVVLNAHESVDLYKLLKNDPDDDTPSEAYDETNMRKLATFFKDMLVHCRPILLDTTKRLFEQFAKNLSCRLSPSSPTHKYYSEEELPGIVPKETYVTPNREANAVTNFNSHVEYLLCKLTGQKTLKTLPCQAYSNRCIVDEAGRQAAIHFIFDVFMAYVTAFLYNSAWMYDEPLVLVLTGSDSQSRVIDYPLSMLTLIMQPVVIIHDQHILIVKSEHNRRIQQFRQKSDRCANMHLLMQETLERSCEKTNSTFAPLLFNEVFESQMNNPLYHTQAVRTYQTHREVAKYETKLTKTAKQQVTVNDYVYVCTNLIRPDVGGVGVNPDHLSTLSPEQAARNRSKLWRKKNETYKDGEEKTYASVKPRSEERPTTVGEKRVFSECGFDSDLEERIVSCAKRARVQVKQAQKCAASKPLNIEITRNESATTEPPLPELAQTILVQEPDAHLTFEDRVRIQHGFAIRGTEVKKTVDLSKIRAIMAPAEVMLSAEEHHRHRQSCGPVIKSLGKGVRLCKEFYTVSQATNQLAPFEHAPELDFCVQMRGERQTQPYADLTYMVARRTRSFPINSRVINGTMFNTKGQCKGVCGTAYSITTNEMFTDVTSPAFQTCVKVKMLEIFQRFTYQGYCENQTSYELMDRELFRANAPVNVPPKCAALFFKFDQYLRGGYKEKHRQRVAQQEVLAPPDKPKHNWKAGLAQTMADGITALINIMMALTDNTSLRFINRQRMDIYVEKSPVYDELKYSVNRVESLSKYISHQSSLVVLGDGWHRCCEVENTQRLDTRESIEYPQNRLRFLETGNFPCNFPTLLDASFESWYPEIAINSQLTLLADDVLIFRSCPSMTSKLPWAVVLNNKTQMVTRNDAPTTSCGINASSLINQHFISPTLVNLPLPFVANECPSTVKSTVVAKTTTGEFIPFARADANSGLLKRRDPESMANAQTLELLMLPAKIQPMILDAGQTIDSLQGKTINTKLLCNMTELKPQNMLVPLTRTRASADTLAVSATQIVTGQMKQSESEQAEWVRQLGEKRRFNDFASRYSFFK